MLRWDLTLPLVCAASAVAWTALAARRSRAGGPMLVGRALLGGAAAFGLANVAYDLLMAAGLPVTWEQVTRRTAVSAAAVLVIGLVEEGAKLTGILLALGPAPRTRHVLACAAGVAAGFAGLEALVSLSSAGWSAAALARAALAPVAHGLLLVPVALGVAAQLAAPGRPLRPAATGLAASALLHANANLSAAFPHAVGAAGFAAALLAPALLLHAHARRAAMKGLAVGGR
jgi:RsiW-degrading membrane proteinase PrsW (M82 family)